MWGLNRSDSIWDCGFFRNSVHSFIPLMYALGHRLLKSVGQNVEAVREHLGFKEHII